MPQFSAPIAVVVAALLPAWAAAQSAPAPTSGDWRYSLSLYAYVPSVDGASNLPAGSGGTPIHVNGGNFLDHLNFPFMGSFGAHNGRWGVFTDFIYVKFDGSRSASRDFSIGNIGLPANTTGDFSWDLTGKSWTLGAEYRLASSPSLTLDVLAGARMLDIKSNVSWSISGSLGPIAPDGRTGSSAYSTTLWDGIVGAKGRYGLDAAGKWALPFYVDVGAGDSNLTWQAAAGVSYAFSWGELTGMWRYLSYDLKSGSPLKEVNFSGPMVGATFRW